MLARGTCFAAPFCGTSSSFILQNLHCRRCHASAWQQAPIAWSWLHSHAAWHTATATGIQSPMPAHSVIPSRLLQVPERCRRRESQPAGGAGGRPDGDGARQPGVWLWRLLRLVPGLLGRQWAAAGPRGAGMRQVDFHCSLYIISPRRASYAWFLACLGPDGLLQGLGVPGDLFHEPLDPVFLPRSCISPLDPIFLPSAVAQLRAGPLCCDPHH